MPARRCRAGKLRSRREGGSRLSCCGVIPRLEYLAKALGIALRPAASDCGVVVHENVGTVRDWLTLEQRIYKDEELAVLITGRVKIFLVVPAELPIVEASVGVTIRSPIGVEAGRQHSRHGRGLRPKFNVEKVRRVVPGRTWIQRRFAFWSEWIIKAFKHFRSP